MQYDSATKLVVEYAVQLQMKDCTLPNDRMRGHDSRIEMSQK